MFMFDFKPLFYGVKKPRRATKNSIGYDVYSPLAFYLPAGGRRTISLGFCSQFTEGYAALLWDKSGLAHKKGLTVLAGLIDPDYPDEWGVVLLNTGDQDINFELGEKICQLFFFKAEFPEGLESDDVGRTGGFGSTGNS